MLFTRCPDCETTFRITADALRKADGQVRCGRCARVFNAYHELRRRSRRGAGEKRAHSSSQPAAPAPANEAAAKAVSAAPAHEGSRREELHPRSSAAPRARAKGTAGEKDPTVGDISFSSVIAELKASAASDDVEADDTAGDPAASEAAKPAGPAADMSTTALLAKNGLSAGAGSAAHSIPDQADKRVTTADGLDAPPAWVILDDAPPKQIATWAWTVGCIAVGALLALQVLHHYRANIAVLGLVGPIVQDAYALVGAEVAPAWDLTQYEIAVDWDAVSQPSADGESNLSIAARIRNNGPRALPLPHVQVQLKDRWESTIGTRVFAPSEYLPRGARPDRMMTAGQTMLAKLDILDPGPQAYGFELDVCVDAQTDELRCAADEVFR